jgi:hypothetical protein
LLRLVEKVHELYWEGNWESMLCACLGVDAR